MVTVKILPIFLDIDGVLNSARSVGAKIGRDSMNLDAYDQLCNLYKDGLPYGAEFALTCVDPVAVGLFNRLLKETGATLVLSSTHRKHLTEGTTYGSKEHLRRLQIYLRALGVTMGGEPHRFFITDSLGTPRGYEVQDWLNTASDDIGYTIEKYVIIDDGSDFEPDQPHVHCDSSVGFSWEDYKQALHLLGFTPSQIIT